MDQCKLFNGVLRLWLLQSVIYLLSVFNQIATVCDRHSSQPKGEGRGGG